MKINFGDIPDPGDRYDFGDILGFGVYGKVYSAIDNQASKKKVAIKLQKYEDDLKQYVEEEYKILRDLNNHLNLIDFYGIYRKDNEIWFVLELCEGGPVIDLVQGLLAKNRRMAEEHIAYVIKESVKALIYLHENNVIHMDVKGSNILLTREGEVKLCDFGLSQKLVDKDQTLFKRLGSPSWMAPELAVANPRKKNTKYDNRVDVWAIGITAIELSEGRAPFQDMHPTRVLFQIVANPPPTLEKLSYWSENYHDFISECLVKYYDYRPYIVEIIDHPFLQVIPENNYHLTLEIKTLLSDIEKTDPLNRSTEININGKFLKKSVDGNLEPMYEEDLAALDSITETGILALLKNRVDMGEYYTFIGDVLLYLNPNENRDIYGDEFHRKYSLKSRSENAPHIYSIGDTAYQNALHHCFPQQILLSGETGSGKTTNYLHLLNHLFFLGENPSINSERIKNAVKLIHSLIHASTPANDYSTRSVFKTIISYGKTGRLSCAQFKVHCLEKWRVSSTDMSQSNFHFVYYIYDGLLTTNCTEAYKLDSNREYRYLRIGEVSKTSQPKGNIKQNAEKYKKIKNYLEDLEFSEEQIETIISVAAAILNLGETCFREDDDYFAELDNKEPVERFSELLEVDTQKVCWALTNYCLAQGGRAVRKKNSCEEARDIRDVLANNLYARLVDYIVGVINNRLDFAKAIFGDKYSIKILDCFGFECYKQNHLSQFMVNCLNEQLHYHFLQRVFAWEILDLQNEEAEFTPIAYYNNQDTLNELMSKPEGVLSIIDDASRKGQDGRYILGNIHNQEKSTIIITDTLEFSVAHYTGKVSYNARDMPEKNRDFLPPEIIETMRNSQNPIISMFFTNKLDKTGNLIIPMKNVRKKKYTFMLKTSNANQFSQIRKMRTQAAIFRALSLDLLKELSVGSGSGGTHFVRCVRTDLQRRPKHFEKELIRQQIRALAVVETAKARQQGYPHRISFAEFLRRYKFLAFDFDENVDLTRDSCRLLMIRLKMEGWALGKSKIFLKYHNEEYLSRLYETQVKKIIKIQSILRGFIAKCRVAKKIKEQEKECIGEIQKRRRSSVMTEEEAAEVIQKAYRKSIKRKELSEMYEPLEEEDFNFIKPFADKWKNKSMFSVLMRYRAIKIQDFFNFSQQVHFYNSNVFYTTQQIVDDTDLNNIDNKATICTWLGDNIKPVLKLKFRLDEIPFYDTSHMYDLLTNLGTYEKEASWDTPYRWRRTCSKENKEELQPPETIREILSIDYIRDPNESILPLSSPVEDIEELIQAMDSADNNNEEDVNEGGSPVVEVPEIKSDDENMEKDDSNAENIDLKNGTSATSGEQETESSDSRKIEDSGDEIDNLIKDNDIKKEEPQIEKIDFKKVYKNESEQENYIVNTKPANKDFDYIKVTPITLKHKPTVDPIEELRNIARKDNPSDDDPPFNFQGMLRKTNFRRDSLKKISEVVRKDSLKNAVEIIRKDSLKNAVEVVRKESLKNAVTAIRDSPKKGEGFGRRDSLKDVVTEARRDSLKNALEAVRKFSLTKEQEKTEYIVVNGHNVEDEPILSKPITLEILPGLFIDGLEIEL